MSWLPHSAAGGCTRLRKVRSQLLARKCKVSGAQAAQAWAAQTVCVQAPSKSRQADQGLASSSQQDMDQLPPAKRHKGAGIPVAAGSPADEVSHMMQLLLLTQGSQHRSLQTVM